MAVDPKARLQTVSYTGGRASATLGLLEKLFGTQNLSWVSEDAGTFERSAHQRERVIGQGEKPVKAATVKRKSWVGRMASNNATGKVATVYFNDGTNWQLRYSGSFTALKDAVANGSAEDEVLQIMTERGATANKGIPLPKPA